VRIAATADHASLTGIVRPALAGAPVQLQQLGQSGWITVGATMSGAGGAFTAAVQLTTGTYRARVVAGHGFAVGVSKVLKVVVS
jgi:hypothetical protein